MVKFSATFLGNKSPSDESEIYLRDLAVPHIRTQFI
jgi:hypothetical protein